MKPHTHQPASPIAPKRLARTGSRFLKKETSLFKLDWVHLHKNKDGTDLKVIYM